ncbi:MAG: ABC transporter substrate-binding protein [Methanomassiliicoccales archaeon]|nr:ABC transporter substrate-binding protein [Methanomassiliicoccales archaeon]
MDKKIAIIAIIVVAIIVVGAVGITMMGGGDNEKTIYWMQVAPVDQKSYITAGTVDGGVSWEPYCSDSILSGTAHALMQTGDLEGWNNHPCCVVTANTEFAEAHPELVARVLAAHIEASEWIISTIENKTSNPTNYTMFLEMGASFSGRNTTVVAASMENINLLYNLTDELKSYLVNFTNEFISLEQTTSAAVTARGYMDVEDFVDTFVNDTYITLAMSGTLTKVNSTVGTVKLGYLNGDLHQYARVVASNVTMWEGTAYEGKSLFTQWGVDIVGTVYANGPAVMTAYDTGIIDMGYLGSPPAIVKYLNVNTDNSDIRIVAQVNTEGSALIVNSDIQSIGDLDGKTIATPGPGSIQHLWLLAFCEEYGFTLKLVGT